MINNKEYDIYQINSNSLMFGHGFRGDDLDFQVQDSNFGGTEATRFTSLNRYIVYKKISK